MDREVDRFKIAQKEKMASQMDSRSPTTSSSMPLTDAEELAKIAKEFPVFNEFFKAPLIPELSDVYKAPQKRSDKPAKFSQRKVSREANDDTEREAMRYEELIWATRTEAREDSQSGADAIRRALRKYVASGWWPSASVLDDDDRRLLEHLSDASDEVEDPTPYHPVTAPFSTRPQFIRFRRAPRATAQIVGSKNGSPVSLCQRCKQEESVGGEEEQQQLVGEKLPDKEETEGRRAPRNPVQCTASSESSKSEKSVGFLGDGVQEEEAQMEIRPRNQKIKLGVTPGMQPRNQKNKLGVFAAMPAPARRVCLLISSLLAMAICISAARPSFFSSLYENPFTIMTISEPAVEFLKGPVALDWLPCKWQASEEASVHDKGNKSLEKFMDSAPAFQEIIGSAINSLPLVLQRLAMLVVDGSRSICAQLFEEQETQGFSAEDWGCNHLQELNRNATNQSYFTRSERERIPELALLVDLPAGRDGIGCEKHKVCPLPASSRAVEQNEKLFLDQERKDEEEFREASIQLEEDDEIFLNQELGLTQTGQFDKLMEGRSLSKVVEEEDSMKKEGNQWKKEDHSTVALEGGNFFCLIPGNFLSLEQWIAFSTAADPPVRSQASKGPSPPEEPATDGARAWDEELFAQEKVIREMEENSGKEKIGSAEASGEEPFTEEKVFLGEVKEMLGNVAGSEPRGFAHKALRSLFWACIVVGMLSCCMFSFPLPFASSAQRALTALSKGVSHLVKTDLFPDPFATLTPDLSNEATDHISVCTNSTLSPGGQATISSLNHVTSPLLESPSFGSYTDYKESPGSDGVKKVTPVRRSTRLRNQALSPGCNMRIMLSPS